MTNFGSKFYSCFKETIIFLIILISNFLSRNTNASNRGRAIGLDYLIRLQELHVYIGEQGEPKGPGQPGGGA